MIADIGIGITILMYLIKLEVYDDGDEQQVVGIEVSIIDSVVSEDTVSDNKVGYDSWEHTIYAETEYIALQKLLKYRRHRLFEHFASTGYIVGDNKTTDNIVSALFSQETQDLFPELYI